MSSTLTVASGPLCDPFEPLWWLARFDAALLPQLNDIHAAKLRYEAGLGRFPAQGARLRAHPTFVVHWPQLLTCRECRVVLPGESKAAEEHQTIYGPAHRVFTVEHVKPWEVGARLAASPPLPPVPLIAVP